MKLPWVVQNGFWLLGGLSAVFGIIANVRDEPMAMLFFGSITVFCCVMGWNFWKVDQQYKHQRQTFDPYQKAQYHQVRQKTMRVIKGGKNESSRTRKP